MRRAFGLLLVGLAALTPSPVRAGDPADYLKDGKLKEPLEVTQLQGGFAGFTGTYYAIEADGAWSTGSVLKGKNGDPKASGKLTGEQLAQLAKELAKQDLAKLPSYGAPKVNPKVLKIRFGKTVSELQPGPGEGTADEGKAIRARYDAIAQAVMGLCKGLK